MPNRLKPLNQFDFTGGVNLRPETFQLLENELPELLNMEVDPRGGLNVRKGWKAVNGDAVVTLTVDGHLVPTVGTVTTPDPGPLPTQATFVFKVRGPAAGVVGAIAAQFEGASEYSWSLNRGNMQPLTWWTSTDGLSTSSSGLSALTPTEKDEWLAFTRDASLTIETLIGWRSANKGRTWIEVGRYTRPQRVPFDSSSVLRIGGNGEGETWNGRIYSVELRSGLTPTSGSVVWRFDANEYTSGTSYVDPRGRTWTVPAGAITAKVPGDPWDPRNGYAHIKANGERLIVVANKETATNGPVYGRLDNANFSPLVGVTASASPHLADFASWDDDVWVACGNNAGATWNGFTVTALTASATANWQDDYANPGTGKNSPMADLIAQHAGYMFVAGTHENAVDFPNRIRWSHPNNPYAWAADDFIDLSEGGQRITAMIPYSDRLLIFKPDSVWALFGYDADTWELTNISRTVGCAHQQAITRNESGVFFLSWPQGIFAYTEKGNVSELSVSIRAVFQSHQLDPSAIPNVWLGWVDRRLWCSLPYADIPAPDDAQTVFVWDPVLQEQGSWTMFRGAEDSTPGPYLERVDTETQSARYAFVRQYPYMVVLDHVTSGAVDECVPDEETGFATRLRTRWIDAGAPTWKKSWRRPDLLLRALKIDTFVNCRVYHDFDSSNAQRSFEVVYRPDNTSSLWGHFNYGDGTKYGGSTQTTSVERGKTMGRAGTIQLLVEGDPGISWGLNGVVFKYIPRRFR